MKTTFHARKRRKWLPYLVTAIAIIAFAAFLGPDLNRYRELINLSPGLIIAIVVLSLLPDRALVNHLLFRALGANVSFNESYGLSTITTLANQLPFAGGMVAKGVYLKNRFQLAYATYLAATVALYVYAVAAAGLIGVAVISYLELFQSLAIPWEITLGFTIMAFSPILLFLPLEADFLPTSWKRELSRLLHGKQILVANKFLTIELIVLMAIGLLLYAARLWFAFRLVSADIPLTYCLLFSGATLLTQLVSFAPGGLGIREGIVAVFGTVADIDPAVSIIAVGLERVISVGVIAVLGLFYAYILSRKMAATLPMEHTDDVRPSTWSSE